MSQQIGDWTGKGVSQEESADRRLDRQTDRVAAMRDRSIRQYTTNTLPNLYTVCVYVQSCCTVYRQTSKGSLGLHKNVAFVEPHRWFNSRRSQFYRLVFNRFK